MSSSLFDIPGELEILVKETCRKAIYKNIHFRHEIESCELLTLLIVRMRLYEWSTFKLTSKHHVDTINKFFKIKSKKYAELVIKLLEIEGIPVDHLDYIKLSADEHFKKSEYN